VFPCGVGLFYLEVFMSNGWGYLVLFLILTAPLVFWLYEVYRKSFKKGPYDDEFGGLV
jgi:hypothetical protein